MSALGKTVKSLCSRAPRLVVVCAAIFFGDLPQGYGATDRKQSYGLSPYVGIVTGTIKAGDEKSSTGAHSYGLGGLAVGLTFYRDIAESQTLAFAPSLLVDLTNQQIIRNGVEGSWFYHLWGGSGYVTEDYDRVVIKGSTSFSLSVLATLGYFNYAATVGETSTQAIRGSTLESRLGVAYRSTLGSGASWSVALLHTFITFRTSIDKVQPSLTELDLSYRYPL